MDAQSTELLQRLVSKDNAVRENARQELTTFLAQRRGPSIASGLFQMLPKTHGSQRRHVIRAMGHLAEDAGEAIPVLAGQLGDASQRVRSAAYQALVQIGTSAVPWLLTQFRLPQHKPKVQALMIRILGEIGDQRAWEPMYEHLDSIKYNQPTHIQHALGYAINCLRPGHLFFETNSSLCYRLACTMPQPELALERRNEAHPIDPFWAIRKQDRREAIPGLLRVIQRERDKWRVREAIITLASLKAKEAVPLFCRLLNQRNLGEWHREIFQGLGRIGAMEAVPLLLSIAKRKQNEYTRAKAMLALGKIGGFAATSYLSACLSGDVNLRKHAIEALKLLPMRQFKRGERHTLLQEILALPPTEETWLGLCVFLSRWPKIEDPQRGYDTALMHADQFDDALRVVRYCCSKQGIAPIDRTHDSLWPLMRHLRISSTRRQAPDIQELLHNERMAKISHLTLAHLRLQPDIIKQIATSPHPGNVRYLNLSGNPFDDRIEAITELPFFSQVEEFHMANCQLEESTKEKLQQAPQLQGIRWVF